MRKRTAAYLAKSEQNPAYGAALEKLEAAIDEALKGEDETIAGILIAVLPADDIGVSTLMNAPSEMHFSQDCPEHGRHEEHHVGDAARAKFLTLVRAAIDDRLAGLKAPSETCEHTKH